MKSYLNIIRIENIPNIINNMYNSFKNKELNLEDFLIEIKMKMILMLKRQFKKMRQIARLTKTMQKFSRI